MPHIAPVLRQVEAELGLVLLVVAVGVPDAELAIALARLVQE